MQAPEALPSVYGDRPPSIAVQVFRVPSTYGGGAFARPSSAAGGVPLVSPTASAGPALYVGCVARVEIGELDAGVLRTSLSPKLAGFFGGSERDYKVASFNDFSLTVLFSNWVARESAIGRSPLWLDSVFLNFTNWVESGEEERGHLQCKVWIRLLSWPILCWSVEEVRAAVSGYGELWEVDEGSIGLADVSCFRVMVRCKDMGVVPEALSLMVEDRCFRIPVVVES